MKRIENQDDLAILEFDDSDDKFFFFFFFFFQKVRTENIYDRRNKEVYFYKER